MKKIKEIEITQNKNDFTVEIVFNDGTKYNNNSHSTMAFYIEQKEITVYNGKLTSCKKEIINLTEAK